mmetsp:Transcript_18654/g.37707  ORF Transcript_18654/g.37707 Transcript_18654/m.37707 type:complete len:204 (-) Transcript_18654:269-880(-)
MFALGLDLALGNGHQSHGVAPVVPRLGQRCSPSTDIVFVDVEGRIAALVDTEEPTVNVDETLGAFSGTLVASHGGTGWPRDETAELVVHFAPSVESGEVILVGQSLATLGDGDPLAIERHEAVVRVDSHRSERQVLVIEHLKGKVRRCPWSYRSRHAERLGHAVLSLEQVHKGLRVPVLGEDSEFGAGRLVECEQGGSAIVMG